MRSINELQRIFRRSLCVLRDEYRLRFDDDGVAILSLDWTLSSR